MALMGIDLGTTNIKAGIYREDGAPIAVAARETVCLRDARGNSFYDPEQMWSQVVSAMTEVAAQTSEAVHSIGIVSMAESGLFVERRTGKPKSSFMPWFDTCTTPQAQRIAAVSDPYERFCATGMYNSYKVGLAKILWLQEHEPAALNDSVWLSAAGYIAWRLTGRMAADDSLAARTYAYDIRDRKWDRDWLEHFGLGPSLFPEVTAAGTPLGAMHPQLASQIGLNGRLLVAISGHDHVAAALSVGAIEPGYIYNSMGTAETLVGTITRRTLGKREYATGFSFGVHAAAGKMFWMGGNSASGGSIEWFRQMLGDQKISYAQVLEHLESAGDAPTGMLYYPYLSGTRRGAKGASMRAALIGFESADRKGDLLKAVLEGTAYELQSMRLDADLISEAPIRSLTVVGGGTRNRYWLQIKANVLGLPLDVPEIDEASLLGAALCAAIGAGVYASAAEAAAALTATSARVVQPNMERHRQYRQLYESGYLPLQQALRTFYSQHTRQRLQ